MKNKWLKKDEAHFCVFEQRTTDMKNIWRNNMWKFPSCVWYVKLHSESFVIVRQKKMTDILIQHCEHCQLPKNK